MAPRAEDVPSSHTDKGDTKLKKKLLFSRQKGAQAQRETNNSLLRTKPP
jgi:hypothetical protein